MTVSPPKGHASEQPTEPNLNTATRSATYRLTSFLRRHNAWTVGILTAIGAYIFAHGLSQAFRTDATHAAATARTYAGIIPTILIAAIVESAWLRRNVSGYFTEEEKATRPDADAIARYWITTTLVIGLLAGIAGEFSALSMIGLKPNQLQHGDTTTPAVGCAVLLTIMMSGIIWRLTLVDDETSASPGSDSRLDADQVPPSLADQLRD